MLSISRFGEKYDNLYLHPCTRTYIHIHKAHSSCMHAHTPTEAHRKKQKSDPNRYRALSQGVRRLSGRRETHGAVGTERLLRAGNAFLTNFPLAPSVRQGFIPCISDTKARLTPVSVKWVQSIGRKLSSTNSCA